MIFLFFIFISLYYKYTVLALDFYIGASSIYLLDCDGTFEKPFKNIPHAISKFISMDL